LSFLPQKNSATLHRKGNLFPDRLLSWHDTRPLDNLPGLVLSCMAPIRDLAGCWKNDCLPRIGQKGLYPRHSNTIHETTRSRTKLRLGSSISCGLVDRVIALESMPLISTSLIRFFSSLWDQHLAKFEELTYR
jgi:hypothetical protein